VFVFILLFFLDQEVQKQFTELFKKPKLKIGLTRSATGLHFRVQLDSTSEDHRLRKGIINTGSRSTNRLIIPTSQEDVRLNTPTFGQSISRLIWRIFDVRLNTPTFGQSISRLIWRIFKPILSALTLFLEDFFDLVRE
jgi:hypothetical protein